VCVRVRLPGLQVRLFHKHGRDPRVRLDFVFSTELLRFELFFFPDLLRIESFFCLPLLFLVWRMTVDADHAWSLVYVIYSGGRRTKIR
jgi:hypothetical protein